MVVLDHLGPVDLALLLGTIYAVMAGREPRFAQTFVLVVVEAARPMALPLLLGIIHHQDMPCWRLIIGIDADGCCMRQLGREQLFAIDVYPILRLCPLILRPYPDASFADKASAEDHGLDIVPIVSRPIGLGIIGRQMNDTRQSETLREQTYRVVHRRDRWCHFLKQDAGHLLSRLFCRGRARVTAPRRTIQVGNRGPV
jgi:hypothetical protein